MKRFVEGIDRGQATLFPECLEDWINENSHERTLRGPCTMSLTPSIVLQNSTAFCSSTGFEHCSACDVLGRF